jgi:hypothetical protein
MTVKAYRRQAAKRQTASPWLEWRSRPPQVGFSLLAALRQYQLNQMWTESNIAWGTLITT